MKKEPVITTEFTKQLDRIEAEQKAQRELLEQLRKEIDVLPDRVSDGVQSR